MTLLSGKVVLITGASSGIGSATALLYSSHGAKVALTGRKETNLDKIAKECRSTGAGERDVLTIAGDMSNEDDVKKILETTIQHFGNLDILVNNAGILIPGTIENTPLGTYDQIMNVNVRSLFQLTQLAVPHLKKTKGNIVNVSSIAGPKSFPGISAYCISKAAVDQFTKCTALELASYGVRVNSVNPGVIITEIHKRGGMSEEDYAKFLEHSKETHALGRPGTAEEVAKAIVFLSDEFTASFITGVNLPVDGGRGAMCPR